jgi:hypothetical protein
MTTESYAKDNKACTFFFLVDSHIVGMYIAFLILDSLLFLQHRSFFALYCLLSLPIQYLSKSIVNWGIDRVWEG